MRIAMTNTFWESTAYRGGESHSDSAGSLQNLALGSSPHLFTAVDGVCQEDTSVPLPIHEPMISRIRDSVDTAFTLHAKAHGATVSVVDGNMKGRRLYAVAIYPDRTVELTAPPSWWQLFAFALTNVDVLLKPGRALGTWSNKQLVHVFDIVVCIPDRAVAIALGLRFNQASIYDLALGEDIPLSRLARLRETSKAEGANASEVADVVIGGAR